MEARSKCTTHVWTVAWGQVAQVASGKPESPSVSPRAALQREVPPPNPGRFSPDPPLWGWFWGVGTEKMPLLIWDNGCW